MLGHDQLLRCSVANETLWVQVGSAHRGAAAYYYVCRRLVALARLTMRSRSSRGQSYEPPPARYHAPTVSARDLVGL